MSETIDNSSGLDNLFNEISNDELMGENVLEKRNSSLENQIYGSDEDMKAEAEEVIDYDEREEEENRETKDEIKEEIKRKKNKSRSNNRYEQEEEAEEELNGPKPEVGPDEKILEARRDFEEALSKLKGGKRKKDFDSESVNLDDIAVAFTNKMLEAVKKDDEAVAEERPALEKLKMLTEVTEMLTRKHMQEVLLDNQVLDVIKKWLEPNIRGNLAVHSVKKRILELLSNLPIETAHLRESGLGKIVMFYYQRKGEDLDIKKLAGDLITTWSRPIIGLDYREMITSQLNHLDDNNEDSSKGNSMKRLQSDKFKKLAKSGVLDRDAGSSPASSDSRFRKLTSTLNRQKNKKK